MNLRLLTLKELGTDASLSQFGGKAASLGRLMAWGMPVPDGFVIGTGTYEEHIARASLSEQLAPDLRPGDWAAVEKTASHLIATTPLAPELTDRLAAAWRELGPTRVAVRSSGTAEDLPDASFAGQYDTFLDIADFDALLRAVRACWASLWSQRAARYRAEHGIPQTTATMAVIVQRMVPATAAGVIFTVDPLSQSRDRMLLEIAPGLGDALVSGRTRGESCLLDRSSAKLRPTSPPRLITPAQLHELGTLALQVEARTGCPQDIEFAFAEGRLSLLQARPITTLGDPVSPPPPPDMMDRRMRPLTCERYAIAPRPLDIAVFTRMVGAAAYASEQFGLVITPAAYDEFRRTLWHQRYRLPRYRLTLRALLHPVLSLRLLREDWLNWWLAGPRQTLEKISTPVDLRQLDDDALFTRASSILTTWEEPLNRRFYATCAIDAETYLKALVVLAVGRAAAAKTMGQLLSGIATPTSETNSALWSLSRIARSEPETLAAIQRDDWTAIPRPSAFAAALDDFFARFGHRESGGFYLSAPTWRHDPTSIRQLLRTLIAVEQRPETPDTVHLEARALVEHRLRYVPWLRRRFVTLLDQIRTLHRFREISHFDLTRPLDALQSIAAEIGRRLRERGLAEADDDVFYLTFDEARQWLIAGPPPGTNPKRFLSRRRATYRLVNARWQTNRSRPPAGGNILRGAPASPGRIRGVARIVLDEREFDRLRPGEVLVCPHSNPSWTPLFLTAAAVISETGGAASHAAIVAREYGLPAVLAIDGATQILRDGQPVEVDGDRGTVTVLKGE